MEKYGPADHPEGCHHCDGYHVPCLGLSSEDQEEGDEGHDEEKQCQRHIGVHDHDVHPGPFIPEFEWRAVMLEHHVGCQEKRHGRDQEPGCMFGSSVCKESLHAAITSSQVMASGK